MTLCLLAHLFFHLPLEVQLAGPKQWSEALFFRKLSRLLLSLWNSASFGPIAPAYSSGWILCATAACAAKCRLTE